MKQSKAAYWVVRSLLCLTVIIAALFYISSHDESYTLSDKALITRKWIASFFRAERRRTDYPVRVRQNGENPPADSAWIAQILNWPGPVGIAPTKEQAIAQLEENLEDI